MTSDKSRSSLSNAPQFPEAEFRVESSFDCYGNLGLELGKKTNAGGLDPMEVVQK
jgi:hypothetical protein